MTSSRNHLFYILVLVAIILIWCAILKHMEGLRGEQGEQGEQGPKGDTGDVTLAMRYGSFYDLSSQQGADNSIQAIYCNYTDFNDSNSGVTMKNSTGGSLNASRIIFITTGRYNIQFSFQLYQTNSSADVSIWLRKNGVNVDNTNTKLHISANSPYLVAAWNFFVDVQVPLNGSVYYEIVWSSTKAETVIEYVAPGGGQPAVPSVILTVNQIGL